MLQVKKVILFDAFSFVGYGLCANMIENEIHVVGIDAMPKEGSPEEDKMLRIGRNANFEFREYNPKLFNLGFLEKSDAVIYPWFRPAHITQKEEDKDMITILRYCNNTKTKFVLASAYVKNNCDMQHLECELDEHWYTRINMDNNLIEHRKIRTKNIEFLFSFIDFSTTNFKEGINKMNEHEEWISQYI